jgi:hypothetical protein
VSTARDVRVRVVTTPLVGRLSRSLARKSKKETKGKKDPGGIEA